MSTTTAAGLTQTFEVRQPFPFCYEPRCQAFDGLICDAGGAHKAALAHAEVTGHLAAVNESTVTTYARTGGGQ